jgi:hypothetical protein
MYRLLNMLLIVIITKYTILYYNPDINDTVSHVSHGMKTLTVAFTTTLHIKQDFIAGAQSLHVARCPHGRNATSAGNSSHNLQFNICFNVVCSLSEIIKIF